MSDPAPPEKPKKPKGWYSKAEKEKRRVLREARAAQLKVDQADRLERKVVRDRHAKRAKSKNEAVSIGHAKTIDVRIAAGKKKRADQARADAQLRRELQTKKIDDNPHLRRHHRISSFQKMIDDGQLDQDMFEAAEEITKVYEAMTQGLMARGMRVELAGMSGAGPQGIRLTEKLYFAHRKRFVPWANDLSRVQKMIGTPAFGLTIDVIINRKPLRDLEERYGIRNGVGGLIVRRCLIAYAVRMGRKPESAVTEFECDFGIRRRFHRAPDAEAARVFSGS